jgi:hypothetical protein
MSRDTIRAARALCATAAAAALALALPLAPQPIRAQAPAAAAPATANAEAAGPHTPDAHKAREAFDEGRRAEEALDWPSAYADETQAAELAPDNREYQLRRYLDRFQLVQQYTDRAERERIDGEISAAREDLLHALELDPGYSVAQERLEALAPEGTVELPDPNGVKLGGAPTLQPRTGSQAFNFRGQTRSAYGQIAQQFGVLAQFDADLPDRPVRLQLDSVDFPTAMKVLGAATHTFWSTIDAHTFFVADDTLAKRRDYAPEVERTFILPDSSTTEDMTETVRMIREIAGINRAELDTASRRMTLRDTPEHIALAEALLGEIEQPRGELLLEIEILDVDRTLSRQLGITPPTSTTAYSLIGLSESQIRSLQQAEAANNGTLLTTIESIFSGLGLSSSTSGSSAMLPAVIAFGGGRSTFLATLPSASANFASTLSEVRSAQRLLLRVEDGQKASFFSGARFPVSLATLSANQSVSPTELGTGALTGTLPTTAYATGTAPIGIITENFNPDGGFADLAVANQAADTVSILLGNGDGTFAAHVDYPAGVGPAGLAAGTFTSSSNPDLAVADFTGNTVSILLGNGDGTFQAPTMLTAGNGPVAIVTGIFNNVQGTADLAVVNKTAGTVSIFMGNGDGTFSAKTDYQVGTSPSAIVAGDFNGDGNLDLAVTNQADNTVSILLGNGDGTFKPQTTLATGAAPSSIVTADFNLDGNKDLAVANQTDGTVSILLGNGNGTFQPQIVSTAGTDPTSLVEADFNNDGRPDIVVTNGSLNEISVLLGNGDGSLETPLSFPTANNPVSVAATDFNADDLTDVAVADEASDEVSVILNSATALGSSSTDFVPYPSAQYVDLGLNVHATPRINGPDEVTLDLQFEISSLAGESINGIPVLSSRTVDQTVRLKENQTSIISGVVQSSEMGAISGWPWIGQASAIGALGSNQNQQNSESDMLILITPREVRLGDHTDRSFYAGPGEPGSGGTPLTPEVPSPANMPSPAQIPAPPQMSNPAPNSGPAPSTAPVPPSNR